MDPYDRVTSYSAWSWACGLAGASGGQGWHAGNGGAAAALGSTGNHYRGSLHGT